MAITLDDLDQAIRGNVTIYRGDRPIRLRLTKREIEKFNAATVRGWVEQKSEIEDTLFNAYWEYCTIARRAAITVRKKTRWAYVALDMWPVQDLSLAGIDLAYDAYDRAGAPSFAIRNIYSHSYRVPVANAYTLADELVLIANDQANWEPARWQIERDPKSQESEESKP